MPGTLIIHLWESIVQHHQRITLPVHPNSNSNQTFISICLTLLPISQHAATIVYDAIAMAPRRRITGKTDSQPNPCRVETPGTDTAVQPRLMTTRQYIRQTTAFSRNPIDAAAGAVDTSPTLWRIRPSFAHAIYRIDRMVSASRTQVTSMATWTFVNAGVPTQHATIIPTRDVRKTRTSMTRCSPDLACPAATVPRSHKATPLRLHANRRSLYERRPLRRKCMSLCMSSSASHIIFQIAPLKTVTSLTNFSMLLTNCGSGRGDRCRGGGQAITTGWAAMEVLMRTSVAVFEFACRIVTVGSGVGAGWRWMSCDAGASVDRRLGS